MLATNGYIAAVAKMTATLLVIMECVGILIILDVCSLNTGN